MAVGESAQEKEFVFEDWLSEGLRGLRERRRRFQLLPEAFWEHTRAARREMLLAFRSLIDAAIERTEARPVKKTTRIKVE